MQQQQQQQQQPQRLTNIICSRRQTSTVDRFIFQQQPRE